MQVKAKVWLLSTSNKAKSKVQLLSANNKEKAKILKGQCIQWPMARWRHTPRRARVSKGIIVALALGNLGFISIFAC